MNYEFQMLPNEFWWGGTSVDGSKEPFDQNSVCFHDFRTHVNNQTMPLYISNFGRCIWSEQPFQCRIENGIFKMDGENIVLENFGTCLKDAYLGAMHKYFPVQGEPLQEEFFQVPQYNTWMQFTYDQTQKGVMEYAKGIIANGFKPGILMIDEGWQKDYGQWEFDLLKFPEPEKMLKELHEMGFTVMLWVVPYVSPNGKFFIKHTKPWLSNTEIEEYFLRTENGDAALMEWWNGVSAMLDFTKPCDCAFLDAQLKKLMNMGVDGFKFDGGSLEQYAEVSNKSNAPLSEDSTPAQRNIAWNDFGTRYKFHEYKDTFKGGGKRVIQRIRDRNHSWDNDGLNTLIPNALLQGLLGHPFVCPDMIGGGEWTYRELGIPVDRELFVRMAQCSAFFPMMQFSWAPWEAVDAEHLAFIKKAHDLHCDFAEEILTFVNEAYETGEPIIRNLEYNHPHCGYEKITDAFMLSDKYLIAPVIQKGQTTRQIPLPEGTWRGFDGKTYEGSQTVELPVTLADIPWFCKST